METFKKRQKEMQRLDRQRHKAEKRKEIKARKAAGIAEPPYLLHRLRPKRLFR